MFHQLKKLGVAQQGFGGDAAPVETNSACTFHLYACHLLAQLRCAYGTDITGWASANNEKIVDIRHGSIPCHGVWSTGTTRALQRSINAGLSTSLRSSTKNWAPIAPSTVR